MEKVKVYYNDASRVSFELGLDMIVFSTFDFEGYTPMVVNKEDVYEKNGNYYLKYGSPMEPYEDE